MLKRTIISFPIEFDSVANGNYDVKLVPGHCIAGSSKAIGKLRKYSFDEFQAFIFREVKKIRTSNFARLFISK